ncbi:MAG TPA: hypothetical protein DIC42_02495 [Holosporales bacterium]|nr:hypothetical protein [Holosporales bacterium]
MLFCICLNFSKLAGQKNIRVIIVKQNLDISQQDMNSKIIRTLFFLFSALERDLMSHRKKEALASKKRHGMILGKQKGTIQKSRFDKDVDTIKELLGYGLSKRKIANVLEYTNHISLTTYLKKRNIAPTPPELSMVKKEESIND